MDNKEKLYNDIVEELLLNFRQRVWDFVDNKGVKYHTSDAAIPLIYAEAILRKHILGDRTMIDEINEEYDFYGYRKPIIEKKE